MNKPEEALKPCRMCHSEKLNLRKTKVCVSDQLSIKCLLCDFMIEYSDWDELVEAWNTRTQEGLTAFNSAKAHEGEQCLCKVPKVNHNDVSRIHGSTCVTCGKQILFPKPGKVVETAHEGGSVGESK